MTLQHARGIAVQTLRHWSIDNPGFAGELRPAPARAFAEGAHGDKLLRLASRLARVKSELTRRPR